MSTPIKKSYEQLLQEFEMRKRLRNDVVTYSEPQLALHRQAHSQQIQATINNRKAANKLRKQKFTEKVHHVRQVENNAALHAKEQQIRLAISLIRYALLEHLNSPNLSSSPLIQHAYFGYLVVLYPHQTPVDIQALQSSNRFDWLTQSSQLAQQLRQLFPHLSNVFQKYPDLRTIWQTATETLFVHPILHLELTSETLRTLRANRQVHSNAKTSVAKPLVDNAIADNKPRYWLNCFDHIKTFFRPSK